MEYFKEWYPNKLNVSEDGTPQTISALKQIYLPKEHFTYAEFGIYKADTARQVCGFSQTPHFIYLIMKIQSKVLKISSRFSLIKFFITQIHKDIMILITGILGKYV